MKSQITFLILFGIITSLFFSCSKDSTTGTDVNGNVTSTMQDRDGNTYKTVVIGTQTWMAENLKTTKYNDGTAIQNITDNAKWNAATVGAYVWYNNDMNNKNVYGALYNGYTIDTEKICPTGWHVPSRDEWDILFVHLGGKSIAAGKLKEVGTTHWKSPNYAATNESGFTALPGGSLGGNDISTDANWYCSDTYLINQHYVINIDFEHIAVMVIGSSPNNGESVRCLKD